jgi:hypothetical protein
MTCRDANSNQEARPQTCAGRLEWDQICTREEPSVLPRVCALAQPSVSRPRGFPGAISRSSPNWLPAP